MPFKLAPLPFPKDSLEPLMSSETVEYHYEKHHRGYVNKLNELVANTSFENMTLEDIINTAAGPIYNNACQAWNHSFFWNCLRPKRVIDPAKDVLIALENTFGRLDRFQADFTEKADELFGSGWVWLARHDSGVLSIESMGNAGNPMTSGLHPLLVLDVWEHAYYLDHRNNRAEFIRTWWNLVNWDFVGKRLSETTLPIMGKAISRSTEHSRH